MLTKEDCDALGEILKSSNVLPYKGKHPERMIQWAEALESGKYEQTTGELRGDEGFCCLGVACDISKLGDWKNDCYLGVSDTLPTKVAEWLFDGRPKDEVYAPLLFKNPYLLDSIRFTELNDDYGLSFRQIAWLIRESVRLGKKSDERR